MSEHKFLTYPVQWYEGMFMVPQHFQQQDALQSRLWGYHLRSLTPHYWGVRSFQIDPAALTRSILRVVALEAVMPDGTVVFLPQDEGDHLEISLAKVMTQEDKVYRVFLTLPRRQSAAEGGGRRYVSVESVSHDMHNADAVTTISRLRPRLNLHVGEKVPAAFVGFPFLHIRVKNHRYVVEDYTPPTALMDHEHALHVASAELAQRLREKLAYLFRKLKTISATTTSAYDKDALWRTDLTRRHLIAAVVPLEALLATGTCLPHLLYEKLLSVAGQCASLQWGDMLPAFPPYDHEAIDVCFQALFTFIHEVLDQIEESYRTFPFALEDRIFSLQLDEVWCRQKLVLGFQAPGDVSENKVRKWIAEAVMSSDRSLDTIKSNRVLGAGRRLIEAAEHLQLVPERGTLLCELDPADPFIVPGERLHIFNISDDPAWRPQQVLLYVDEDLVETAVADKEDTLKTATPPVQGQ